MKKPAGATKQKATKMPATAVPAQEAVTVASQPTKATRPARKAKAAKPATKKAAEALSAPAADQTRAAKEPGTTKKDIVIALIGRKDGATLADIIEATGWQKHTIRGFISIVNKGGAKIESSKSEAGARTYKAA